MTVSQAMSESTEVRDTVLELYRRMAQAPDEGPLSVLALRVWRFRNGL